MTVATPVTPTASKTPVARRATRQPGTDTGPLDVGQSFGTRYHIIRLLGIGGMGAVYQAWDAELGVAVAIKVIRPEVMEDPVTAEEVGRRFKRELLLARQVTHKNVVRIHDLGDIDGIKYITMSYVEGTDLSTILKKDGKRPVRDLLHIARAVISGLVAAHSAGVVHRDLKPANIMISNDGEALIMDFGIAHSTGEATGTPTVSAGELPEHLRRAASHHAATTLGSIVGTLEYMAPEQARGQAIDQRADVYAFGLILYDALLGRRRVSSGAAAVEELQRRMTTAPPPLQAIAPEIPAPLAALVARCVEPDAEKRFQTSADVATELARIDDTGELIPIKRVVRLPYAIAAAVLLVATSVGVWWYQRQFIPPKTPDPIKVVIADFVNETKDPAFDGTLEPQLRRVLEGATFISAYDRRRIGGLGVQAPEHLDEASALLLAANQGVATVISGSVVPRGGGYRVVAKATRVAPREVIDTQSADAAGKDQVLEVATRLMARIRTALGDDTPESAQLFAMRSVSASSLELVRHYTAAIEAQSRGQFEDARSSYLKAVELDSTFALGYQGLAAVSQNLDRPEDADKYINEALKHLDGLTDREKFATRGYYYLMIGDNQQCVKEYGKKLENYPADIVSHNQRAICLKNLRQMRQAAEEMRAAVKMLPNHAVLRTNFALFLAFAGDFEGAEREVASIQQPLRTALAALAYGQIGRGRLQEATATYNTLSTMDARSKSLSASGLGDVLIYQGRFGDAIRTLQRGAEADLATKSPHRAGLKWTTIAYAHLMAGRTAAAIAAANTALMTSTTIPVRFLAARTFVEAGAVDRARPLAAALFSEAQAEPKAYGKIIEGLIALKEGRANDAIKTLTEANGLLDTWFGHFELGRAYLAAKMFVQADSEFDGNCIARRGEATAVVDDEEPSYGQFPLVYYYLGQAREGVGSPRFAESYREYLKMRGTSTEDPKVKDARRRAAE
jgi:tetratricopeptide (TPR) repeat protein